jgi:peroxiredoxin
LQSPVFERINAIAKELGLPDDWRILKPPPGDVGQRPDLASLGPASWSPSPAAPLLVKTAEGQDVTLEQYRGRPVVLIFFLGHGCLHCAQQLHAFAPLKEKFAAAGFDILAVSSDDAAGLQKSVENYTDGPLPLPLASDATLAGFKAYRCYDDFEQQPLHGTFVIDAAGNVRWQDIGFEPFMDAKFLLAEAQRLIAIVPPAAATSEPATTAGAVTAPAGEN